MSKFYRNMLSARSRGQELAYLRLDRMDLAGLFKTALGMAENFNDFLLDALEIDDEHFHDIEDDTDLGKFRRVAELVEKEVVNALNTAVNALAVLNEAHRAVPEAEGMRDFDDLLAMSADIAHNLAPNIIDMVEEYRGGAVDPLYDAIRDVPVVAWKRLIKKVARKMTRSKRADLYSVRAVGELTYGDEIQNILRRIEENLVDIRPEADCIFNKIAAILSMDPYTGDPVYILDLNGWCGNVRTLGEHLHMMPYELGFHSGEYDFQMFMNLKNLIEDMEYARRQMIDAAGPSNETQLLDMNMQGFSYVGDYRTEGRAYARVAKWASIIRDIATRMQDAIVDLHVRADDYNKHYDLDGPEDLDLEEIRFDEI